MTVHRVVCVHTYLEGQVPTGKGETEYTAYFAPENGNFRLVSSLRKPKPSANLTGQYSFLENILPNPGCYTRMEGMVTSGCVM